MDTNSEVELDDSGVALYRRAPSASSAASQPDSASDHEESASESSGSSVEPNRGAQDEGGAQQNTAVLTAWARTKYDRQHRRDGTRRPLQVRWRHLAPVRRPWQVFEMDSREQAAAPPPVCPEITERLVAIRRLGRRQAFAQLSQEEQLEYHEVSIMELAAFLSFDAADKAHWADGRPTRWCQTSLEDKAAWITESPREVSQRPP